MDTVQKDIKYQEVYGFVAYVFVSILIVFYLAWAFVPDDILVNYLGLSYYPSKHWAKILPSIIIFILLGAVPIFWGNVHRSIHSQDSVLNLQDEFTLFIKKPQSTAQKNIPGIHDIPINVVNQVLYYNKKIKQEYNQRKKQRRQLQRQRKKQQKE